MLIPSKRPIHHYTERFSSSYFLKEKHLSLILDHNVFDLVFYRIQKSCILPSYYLNQFV